MIQNCKMNVNPKIKKVVFELLSYCNLNCCYCIYHNKRHPKDSSLSIHEIYKLIDKFYIDGVDRLVLTGGEPTLHPNFIDISKYAILKIPKVSVCTNGVILNKTVKEEMINLNFSSYTISIDSCIDEIHDKIRGVRGSFGKSFSFLEKLKLANKNISIHITINTDNIDSIYQTINFAKGFSKEIIVSTIYYEKGKKKELTDRDFYAKLNKVFDTYSAQKNVVLIGFGKSCSMEHCLDKKNVFMVNQFGKVVDCYWKNFTQM